VVMAREDSHGDKRLVTSVTPQYSGADDTGSALSRSSSRVASGESATDSVKIVNWSSFKIASWPHFPLCAGRVDK
jgi:hypothetical protein